MFLAGLWMSTGAAHAINCSGLPTQFTGNEFPKGNFFSNFNNPCYFIYFLGGGGGGTSGGDANAVYWKIWYKVNPQYQLILMGEYPNARYFSVTVYDDHSAIGTSIMDTNIVPLTSSFVNPYEPGVAFVPGQKYIVPINFEGTPGTPEKGCTIPNGYNVAVNNLDATMRHAGMNWNVTPAVFQKLPNFPQHIVDTPTHTAAGSNGPNTGGVIMIRAYLNSPVTGQTAPRLIVRDAHYGCAYPAAYVMKSMQPQVVTNNKTTGQTWINTQQTQSHVLYQNAYLIPACYGPGSTYPPNNNPPNPLSWSRGGEYVPGDNPDASYITADTPAGLTSTIASAGQVMRMRLHIPQTPPTPCTNGCSRSGNEQMRYMSMSFQNGNQTLASIADNSFVQDANGYTTLIVGTGATIPSWVTAANGYTFLDLAAISGYQSLQSIVIRNLIPANNFNCGGNIVPFNTTVYTPPLPGVTNWNGLMGDYLPVVDYPVASLLPQTATAWVGANSCGVLPTASGGVAGRAAYPPFCGVTADSATSVTTVEPPIVNGPPVSVQALPPIALAGGGFGVFPTVLPYTGTTSFLQITDVTQGWSAGYIGSPCTVSISNWATNIMELVANVGGNGGLCPLVSGDQLSIQVWNPQNAASTSTITTTVAP